MIFVELHRRLGKASGGAGPVGRWIWAGLLTSAAVSLVFLLRLAVANQ